jgi:putative sigma-54 modulation protein
MNLQVSGHHLEITPALRDYVTGKLERITRHFDNVIDVNVILSVDKLKQKAEVTVHLAGKGCLRGVCRRGPLCRGGWSGRQA